MLTLLSYYFEKHKHLIESKDASVIREKKKKKAVPHQIQVSPLGTEKTKTSPTLLHSVKRTLQIKVTKGRLTGEKVHNFY